MSENINKKIAYSQRPFLLTKVQWDWLESMATKHKLSSLSKAVRCCVNFAALENIQLADKSTAFDGEDGIEKQIELSHEQITWIARWEESNVTMRLIKSCMATDEYTVFGIIRCKSSVAKCEGAQLAILNIGEKFGKKEKEVVVKENIDILSEECCGCTQQK